MVIIKYSRKNDYNWAKIVIYLSRDTLLFVT